MPKIESNPRPFPQREAVGSIRWSMLKDGRQYRFVAGEDFTGSRGAVQARAGQAARRMGMKARTMSDGDDLLVQFFPNSGEG